MRGFGVHYTISKGFTYAAKSVLAMGGNTFQFFSRNPRGGQAKVYDAKDIEAFNILRKEESMAPIMAHAPYTVNLASNKESVVAFSTNTVKEDILRMDAVGIDYFNLHPGSHLGEGIEHGIEQIARQLNLCITDESKITVLLESMSGKGSEIGFIFQQLKAIIDKLERPERVGICMDLCHVFSAGYDIVNSFDSVLEELDKTVGIEKLKAIHLNDSMNEFNSKKDRHAPLGKGTMGLDAIIAILKHPVVEALPFYCETPLEDEGHREELQMLRRLLL